MFRIFVKLIKVRVSTSSQSFNIIFHLFSSTGNTCKIPSPKHQAFSSNTSQRAFFFEVWNGAMALLNLHQVWW